MNDKNYLNDTILDVSDFSNYFDLDKMQGLQNAVSKSQDIASLILDTEGNNITKPTRFSAGLIRIVKRNKKVDEYFDQGLMKQYRPSVRTPAVVRNKTGEMMSGCIPIIINDQKVATWIVGGVFDVDMMLPREHYEQLARDTGEDVDKFMEAIEDVHVMSKSDFLGIFEVVRLVAEQMAENLDKNLAQKVELMYKQELMTELEETNVALKVQAERYRLLSECSDEIVFDYDVDTDTVTVPVSSRSGVASDWVLTDFISEKKAEIYVHPDDIGIYREAFRDMYTNPIDIQFEVRLKLNAKDYTWSRFNVVFFKGDSGKLIRVIGRIQNIEKEKEELIELESQVKKDPMTGLLNKSAVALSVEKYLRSSDPGAGHALMIIDIDDFKNVNDTFGHLFGDMVIENVASAISATFRKSDIIGRIGGDEFLVLMKNTGRRIAEIKARDLNKSVRRKYNHDGKEMEITCSVGMAFFNRDADNYEDLFGKADIAMYNAKLEGKNRVSVYDAAKEQVFAEITKEEGRSARFDTDFDADLISIAFGLLFESREIDTSIKILTERVVDRYSIQKVIYNYSVVDEKDHLLTWDREHNKFVAMSEDDFEDYTAGEKILRKKEFVVINDCKAESKGENGEIAAFAASRGMTALIGVGFPVKDGVTEYIIFANTDAPRCWTEFERKTFKQVAEIFVLFARIYRERRSNREEITKLSSIDGVTGIYNRKGFENTVADIMEEYGDSREYIMEYIDIDNFSYVNENFGVAAGNKTLNDVADILKSYRNCCVCRVYGDHFLAFYYPDKEFDPEVTFREQEEFFRMQQKSHITAGRLRLTAGIYRLDHKERNISLAIDNANMARKLAKNNDGAYYAFFDEDMKKQKAHERLITSSFEPAIEKQEFEMFLQPKMNLATNTAVGAEGLVRWKQHDGTYRMPSEFIGVLEKYNFIQQMDLAMLEMALKAIEKWRKDGVEPVPVSINFSKQNSNSPDFVEKIMNLFNQYDVPRQFIEVEINESALGGDIDILYDNLRSLKKKGFTVAIDNFGRGLASLGSLMKAPIDMVKVDRMFLEGLEDSPIKQDYISNMCMLISSVKKQIIFEGVESQEQADFLYSCGIVVVQGFLYGQPVNADEFAKKYLEY
ncbi:MAG: diguanylate cyclase [Lachnospiraceae bacterium]|nr:diguanylate cyclase [Lachnospiraceae bacterium]